MRKTIQNYHLDFERQILNRPLSAWGALFKTKINNVHSIGTLKAQNCQKGILIFPYNDNQFVLSRKSGLPSSLEVSIRSYATLEN